MHSLDPSGDEMTVETLLVVEHGYTLRGAQNYANGKDVYKRLQAVRSAKASAEFRPARSR